MRLRRNIFAAILTAILCVFAPLSFPMGTVPVSMATFGVCLISLISHRRCALISLLLYVALGTVGLPVFAGFVGGAQILVGPTGGYLIGYIPMALIICLFCEKRRTVPRMAMGMTLGLLSCYAVGVLWYAFSANVSVVEASLVGILPYLPFDAVKLIAAGAVAWIIGGRVDKIFSAEPERER